MYNTIKKEMERAFWGRGMILSLLIGICISLTHVLQHGTLNYKILKSIDYSQDSLISPLNVVENWLAGNSYNLQSFLFFLLLPILATLPFGTSYFEDYKSRILQNVYIRTTRTNYLVSKYVTTFISGGIAVTVPLLINLLITFMILPNLEPFFILKGNAIDSSRIGYELYFTHSNMYLLLYLGFDFLLGGTFAVIALASSIFSSHKVIVIISPFFLQLIIYVVCTITQKYEYSSVYFAQAGYGLVSLQLAFIYILLGSMVSLFVFLKIGRKCDVY